MELRHPIEAYTPLSLAELERSLIIAAKLNARWLSISRRGLDRAQREKADETFARELAKHLTRANIVMFVVHRHRRQSARCKQCDGALYSGGDG